MLNLTVSLEETGADDLTENDMNEILDQLRENKYNYQLKSLKLRIK